MLIHEWDRALDDDEWRSFVVAQGFGHLVAVGRDRDVAVVVPTQFVLRDDEMVLHLARLNPVWEALRENPAVLLSVAGDWAFIPSSWKAINDEDPRRGIPTTYYASVQVIGDARVVEDPDGVAEVLRLQLGALQPDVDVIDPSEHASRLRAIAGIRIPIQEVRAKFKYGGNVDDAHRAEVVRRLRARGSPADNAAANHASRRA